MSVKPIKVHLFSGFLGTGKTTAIRSLIMQKPDAEQWLVVVNEFGEIGIDGAVLADNGIPVAEISGGCLCCTAGSQMGETIQEMIAQKRPDRILIEASGLAHAAGVIDELKAPEFKDILEVGAVFTLIDPRQFIDDDYANNPLYRDQVGVCDVLLASKLDLCNAEEIEKFRDRAAKLFPPKSLIAETHQAKAEIIWLDTPVGEKSRYRIKVLPENTLGYQSQGYTFSSEKNFNPEKLSQFFNELPQLCEGLVRAKGVFRIWDTWAWLNWVEGKWGAHQVSWRRDSRFELIAKSFDAEIIEKRLQSVLEDK